MRINEKLSFSGPFRLDTVRPVHGGIWIFDLKIGIRNMGLAPHGGYVLMATGHQGKGLYLQAYDCVSGLQLLLDSEFDLTEIRSIPEASDRFCRNLIELGLGPAYDQKNRIVSSFTPDSFSTLSGALIEIS